MSTVTSSSLSSSATEATGNTKVLLTDVGIGALDFDDFTTTSILEFLSKEQECYYGSSGDASEINDETIFEEVNRLSDNTDTRSIDEILREAEYLMNKHAMAGGSPRINGANGDLETLVKSHLNICNVHSPLSVVSVAPDDEVPKVVNSFDKVVDNVCLDSIISEESTPKDMEQSTMNNITPDDADDDTTDTIEEITEGIETIELLVNDGPTCGANYDIDCSNTNANIEMNSGCTTTPAYQLTSKSALKWNPQESTGVGNCSPKIRTPSLTCITHTECTTPTIDTVDSGASSNSEFYDDDDGGVALSPSPIIMRSNQHRHCNQIRLKSNVKDSKMFCDKATNSSPKHCVSAVTSPVNSISITREHLLKQEIEQLQEKLKDTEERLQSLRIQHDSLSQLHRDLRENNSHLQEESEVLKLDVQHLNECANILRSELQSARNDRNEALDLQRVLQSELEESRCERKKAQEQKEKDCKIIQDLHRQCKEMERILMRKHPDSVSALIVASKHHGKSLTNDESHSRRLLEQRIAQLEADAKEQDKKAQKILANVQARFNSVQSKYETHIADLETQVLSLQEINTKLNEKIESQVRTLDYFISKKSEGQVTGGTQTEEIPECQRRIVTSCTQTDCIPGSSSLIKCSSAGTSASSTPSNSRPGSKQSGLRKPNSSSKLPFSHSDTTISTVYHVAAKEDAHLLATIRGMRVDLAIKDKAMQRLTKEVDECKKTIRKLQKEKDALKSDGVRVPNTHNATSRRVFGDATQCNAEHPADGRILKEAQDKIKLLEFDYKALHDKRLQDLKTLQSAHERELASFHETVRVLQQRLTERDEAYATQKRRKVPIDYYALKAKVSSLERRHTEREERLHMLVEALSKGRLNGALEELLSDNNN